MMYHANKHNKAGLTLLIADKVEFKARSTTRDNEEYFIAIKLVVFQEDNNHKFMCLIKDL